MKSYHHFTSLEEFEEEFPEAIRFFDVIKINTKDHVWAFYFLGNKIIQLSFGIATYSSSECSEHELLEQRIRVIHARNKETDIPQFDLRVLL